MVVKTAASVGGLFHLCRYGRTARPVVASDLRGLIPPDHRAAACAMPRGPGDCPPASTFSRDPIRLSRLSWRAVGRQVCVRSCAISADVSGRIVVLSGPPREGGSIR